MDFSEMIISVRSFLSISLVVSFSTCVAMSSQRTVDPAMIIWRRGIKSGFPDQDFFMKDICVKCYNSQNIGHYFILGKCRDIPPLSKMIFTVTSSSVLRVWEAERFRRRHQWVAASPWAPEKKTQWACLRRKFLCQWFHTSTAGVQRRRLQFGNVSSGADKHTDVNESCS